MTRVQRARQSGAVSIGSADIALLRRRGPAVLDYYRRLGLAETRARATAIAVSGLLPIIGWIWFGWSPVSMLVFLFADALAGLALDWLRLPLARRWMDASHALDQEAGEVITIVDGLEDGSGMRTPSAGRPGALAIMLLATVVSVFLVPVAAAALEPVGLAPLREILAEPWFLPLLAADAGLRAIGACAQLWRARARPPGEVPIFAESGSVVVLYAGMLVLVWLPINFQQTGLLLMFLVLYLARIGFGAFALWWTPRVVAALDRRLQQGDFTVRAPLAAP